MRILAFVLAAALTVGCDVYDETLLDRDGGGGGGGACPGSVEPPARPSGEDDGEDIGDVVYAVKDVVFDQGGERWANIGYNLDGICSEPPDIASECIPPNPSSSPETDGMGGIDNAFGHHLFPTIDLTVPDLEATARGYQERGIGAPVLRLRGWNGERDDSRVDVTAAISVFAVAGSPDDTEPPEATFTVDDGPMTPAGDPLPEPEWDGSDWFWVRADNFFEDSLDRPLIRDDNAYVSGGTLVISLPERTDFVFPGDEIGLLVRLTGAVATAEISADRTRIEKATVAGRWSLIDLLTTAEAVGVCQGTAQYDILLNLLDRIADVRTIPGSGGADVECNAVSIGLEFVGSQVRLAGMTEGRPVPDACEEMMTMPDGGV